MTEFDTWWANSKAKWPAMFAALSATRRLFGMSSGRGHESTLYTLCENAYQHGAREALRKLGE